MNHQDNENLTEIYKSVVQEYLFFVKLFEDRIKFFSGLLTAIISALAFSVLYPGDNSSITFGVFILGSATLLFVATVGEGAADKAARQINRILTERAKLEQALGLTIKYDYGKNRENDLYWRDEPIIATQHLRDRKHSHSSEKFVTENMQKTDNYLARTIRFYGFAKLLGVIGFILAFWLYR